MKHIFIVNPYAGKRIFADDLRRKLSGITGLDYFVFNTRYAGNETEIIKDIQNIFENEKLRFYCCGGSGTMRNMINGFDNLDDAEIAFFPCGETNDFLKVFGKEKDRFFNINELIYGDVINVDYIRSNHGITLNFFSTGLDTTVVNKYESYRMLKMFRESLPYTLSLLYAVFLVKRGEYELEIDGRYYAEEAAELVFANGMTYAGSVQLFPGANVTDGKGCFRVMNFKLGVKAYPFFKAIKENDYNFLDENSIHGNFKNIKIRRKDGMPFAMNMDGELSGEFCDWEAEIVPGGLHLVVPGGVKM